MDSTFDNLTYEKQQLLVSGKWKLHVLQKSHQKPPEL